MAYANADDVAARLGRTLSASEKTHVAALLGEAATQIDAECPPPDDMDSSQGEARRVVSVRMAIRVMASPADIGVSSLQQSAGPFQETRTYSNPTGDVYLTKNDRRLLGCRKQRAFSIDTAPPPVAS